MQGESGEQQQLEGELDRLIARMRTCEDAFLALATHIHALTHPNDALFVHELIAPHRALVAQVVRDCAAGEAEYAGVVQRWAGCEGGEAGSVLLKRVAYRLLEVFFSSVGTVGSSIPHALQDYLRVKVACQRILQGGRPHELIKAIADYEFAKLRKYADLLAQLTNHLENGDLDCLSNAHLASLLEPPRRDQPPPFYSTFKITKLKPPRDKQPSKPEILITEKLKAPTRKARALYENLKDVMEVGRQEFLEDFSFGSAVQETVMQELMARNKMNQQMILGYCAKKRRIQNKLRNGLGRQADAELDTENHFPQEGKSLTSTRKSLLLKIKNPDKKSLPSELFKKTSKFDQVRTRMKSYNRHHEKPDGPAQTQNHEEVMELTECSSAADERLPVLNKRAHSVDQNYKLQEVESPQARTLSNSLKINEDLRVKAKLEKVEMLPAKIKLELKSFNAVASLDVGKKLGKAPEFSKYLYF